MGKKFFLKGLFAAILSITIATIFGSSASYAEAVITRGLYTDSNDVRWEWQKTIDADNEAEPESVSIMFYDKPAAATTIVVPSLSDVITAASASQSLDTYYVRNANQTSQDEYFTSETRRESTADVTVLDMTNTSKVQIMGVKPILNPETEAELIFGENMVIGDYGSRELNFSVDLTFNVCTTFETRRKEGSYYDYVYCTDYETVTFENIHDSQMDDYPKHMKRGYYQPGVSAAGNYYSMSYADGLYYSNYKSDRAYYLSDLPKTTTVHESIDAGVFAGYKLKLTNLENVKYLGWYAFQHAIFNEDSRDITIKANQNAGEGVFAWTNVKSVTFEGTETFPAMFRDCADLVEINLNDVTTISYETFMNTNLGSFNFSTTKVKNILGQAFRNAGLSSINLDGVEVLGYEAFANNNLTELTLPKSIEDINTIRIFAGNPGLSKLTIAYDTMKMTEPLHSSIGEWFYDKVAVASQIKELTLIAPYGADEEVSSRHRPYVTWLGTIGTSGAFSSIGEEYGEDGYGDIYKNVIAPGYFYGFDYVQDLTIGDGYEFIGTNAFYNYLHGVFSGNAGQYYFGYLAAYQRITTQYYHVQLPETLKGIGTNAFGQHAETDFSINLPESLEYIGNHAFKNCAFMYNDVDLPNLKYLGTQAFNVAGVRNVYLHDSLEHVGYSPFQGAWNLHDVTIDYDVFGIGNLFNGGECVNGNGTFGAAMLGEVMVTNSADMHIENLGYYGPDDIIYGGMPWGYNTRVHRLGTITFTEKAVSEIRSNYNYGFAPFYMVAAEKIDISKTPWKILPARSFLGVVANELLLPETLEYIGQDSFQSTRIEEELVLPETLSVINKDAFNCWSALSNQGVSYYDGDKQFHDLDGNIVEVEEQYNEYGYVSGVNGNTSHPIKITKLPSSLEYIGGAAFYGDYLLDTDFIGTNIKAVGLQGFLGTQIRDVYLGENLAAIFFGSFAGIDSLRNITLDCDFYQALKTPVINYDSRTSNGLYTQGYSPAGSYSGGGQLSFYAVFNKFNYVDYYTGLHPVKMMQNEADNTFGEISFTENALTEPALAGISSMFSDFEVTKFDMSKTPWKNLGNTAYMFNRAKIGGLLLPEGLEVVPVGAFYALETESPIIMPETIKELNNYAFQYSKTGFVDAFVEGLTTIGAAAFYGADISGDMVIPESVQSIGLSAFNAGDADTHYDTVTIKAPLDYAKTSNQAVFQMFWNAKMDKLVIESSMLPVLGTLQDEPVLPANIEVDGEMISPLRADGEPEFHGMTMKEVEIKNLPVITANAFEECGNLEKVSFANHDSLTSIERYAFNNDTKLKTFVFGDGLVGKDVKLGTFAFNNTAIETIGDKNTDFALTAANFDASETLVFANLPALKSVYVPGTFTIQSDAANDELFTNGSTIPAYTFAYDPELEEVTLDYQVSRVDDGAFIDDNKLAKLFVWGNTQISESDEFVAATNNLTIPAGTTIFAYSDAPAEQYANAESRDAYEGKFYALDEVLYLTTNRTYVVLNDDRDDFDKSDLKLYALRRDGVILESDNWQEYTTAFPRSTANINFEEGRGAVGDDSANIAAIVYDAPKPFATISLANENYQNVDFAFIQMPSSINPLVLINYPDGYTGNIRTATLASMTKEEEEEYLRRLEEELEVPNTGAFLNVIKTATPVISIAAIVIAGGLFIAKRRKN